MPAEMHSQETGKRVNKVVGLLRSLVPRAEAFSYYDTGRTCIWRSEAADDFEADNFIGALPQEMIDELLTSDEVFRRTLPSARAVVLLPVCNDSGELLGLLASMFSKNRSPPEAMPSPVTRTSPRKPTSSRRSWPSWARR